jgi:hypothetical protein
MREWLFTPMARFSSLDDLNAWLSVRCLELGARKHPAYGEQTIAECYEREKQNLRPVQAAFDGYVEQMMRVSSTCLVRVDRNRYSVPTDFAGKIVSVRTSATRIRVVADNREIADHPDSSAVISLPAIHGTTFLSWNANPVRCAMAFRFGSGIYPVQSGLSGITFRGSRVGIVPLLNCCRSPASMGWKLSISPVSLR